MCRVLIESLIIRACKKYLSCIIPKSKEVVVTFKSSMIAFLEIKNSYQAINIGNASFNTTRYKSFFTNRIINVWNSLSEDMVTATTLNIFKNKFDKTFKHIMYSTRIDAPD